MDSKKLQDFAAPLALPLGELPPQAAERALQTHSACTLSVFASLRHLSQRERQVVPAIIQKQAQQMILLCLLTV